MKTTFLYTLSDPETGKIRYLGKSDNPFKRFKRHLYDQDDSHKSRWVNSLRERGLRPYMELLDEVPESQWKFWEREYIRVFLAIGIPLTNLTDGGDSGPNMEDLSPEVRKRIQEGGKFIRSDEQRKNMSVATKGIPKAAAHRVALSKARTGFKDTPETREKKRVAMLRRWELKTPEEREAILSNLAPFHATGHASPSKGKKYPERGPKTSAALMGHEVSSETRAKISSALRARNQEKQGKL